jgi:hypothetical protein
MPLTHKRMPYESTTLKQRQIMQQKYVRERKTDTILEGETDRERDEKEGDKEREWMRKGK